MHPSRRSLRAAAILFGLLSLLPGCVIHSSSPTATPGPSPSTDATATATTKPEKGGTLVVAVPSEPDVLNFTLTNNPITLDTLSALDARMIRITADGTYDPQLLTEVPTLDNTGVSADGLTWVLHFRPELTWSDGKPLDARDFQFTWKTITNTSYPAVSREGWSNISSIALSPDNLTATLSLNLPSGDLLDTILAGGSESRAGFLLPMHVFGDVPLTEIARSSYGDTEHVGSGPFMLAKWSQNDQLSMVRNDHYFGQSAQLDKIVMRFVSDPQEIMSSLATGELDLGVDLPEASVVDLRQIQSLKLQVTPIAGAVQMLTVNLDDPENLSRPSPILSDLGVRRAMMLGFDRQKIVDELLSGQTSVAISPLDYTRWVAPDLKPYSFAPAEARQALDVAGWMMQSDGVRAKKGARLSFTLTGLQGDSPQAVLQQRIEKSFVDDMAAIGIQVELRAVSADELNADLQSGGILVNRAFEVVNLPNNQRSGVDQFAWRFDSENVPTESSPSGGNIMGYSNLAVDSAIEGESQAVDSQSRSEFLYAAQRAIYRELPVIPIYDHIQVDGSQSYVNGLKPGPQCGLWWNTEDWWINRSEAAP